MCVVAVIVVRVCGGGGGGGGEGEGFPLLLHEGGPLRAGARRGMEEGGKREERGDSSPEEGMYYPGEPYRNL